MKAAAWNNTKVVNKNVLDEIRKLKETGRKDLTILGSGTIVTLFAEAGLIDEYQIMVDPVVLGEGTPIFNGLRHKMDLKLTGSKVFTSGVVLLNYKP
jgi:dihydrofolate reductase